MGCAQGASGLLLLDTDSTFDASSEGFEFRSETFRLTETVSPGDFIRGSTSEFDGQKRVLQQAVTGGFTTYVSPIYASRLISRALGDATSPHTPANSATAFFANVFRVANATNFIYHNLYIRELKISGREGQLLEMSVDCIGKTETTNTAGAIAVTYAATAQYQPMHFSDISTFTIGGTAMSAKAFELTITNELEPKYYNSLTATDICLAGRRISFSATFPYSEEHALYPQSGATAVAVVLRVTNAATYVEFTLPLVRPSALSPNIAGRQDIDIVWSGTAGASATGLDEISVAIDMTP